MDKKAYLQIYEPKNGLSYGDFSLFLPAGDYYCEYRFAYENNPIDPGLHYNEGPNNPANRSFYRIRTAWIVHKEGERFVPVFRVLQQGEVGLAFREEGSGDFVGGFHGDENLTSVSLQLSGREIPLDCPFFGYADGFCFTESSQISRCNTPDFPLAIHDQIYTLDGNTLHLSQSVRWINDSLPIQEAFMPMLTAQRLDPENPCRILTDTVELFSLDGSLAAHFDTTPYGGSTPNGDYGIIACEDTYATSAKVYGKLGGLCIEAGYTPLENSIPVFQISTHLLIRFMQALDNKIYFRIWAGEGIQKGTHWKSNVFYRITFHK